MMPTYELVRLVTEVLAFVSVTAVLCIVVILRDLLKRLFGNALVRGILAGFAVFWVGSVLNVVSLFFPTGLLEAMDGLFTGVGMLILASLAFGLKRDIEMRISPRMVRSGRPQIHPGAYMVRPASFDRLIPLLSGRRLMAVARTPEKYETLGIPCIWLTNVEAPNAVSPTRLAPLFHMLINNVEKGAFVLLEGIEYLLLQNGRDATLKFLLSLKDQLLERGAGIVLVVDEGVIDGHVLRFLEREFEWLPVQ